MTPVKTHYLTLSACALLATAAIAGMGPALAEQASVDNAGPVPADPADDGARPGSVTVPASIATDKLAVLNNTLAELRSMGRTEQALQTANDIAAIIEEQYGVSVELIEPLTTVTELQLELGDRAAAEQTLGRLIGVIELEDSVFSTDLVEPLTMLAGLYVQSNRMEEAITLLRRARHISHRRLGILNMEQIEVADRLADTYFRMGQIQEGSRESRFAYRVNVHEYGGDSADLVPAINKLAAWYERIGEFTAARQYYRRSVGLIEKDYGPDDLRLVDTLQRIADTYHKQRIYKSDGHKALIRALKIHESHPEADEVAHANSLTELGDWSLATLRPADAMELYKRAWNMLTGDGANPERADVVFGAPKRLRYEPPLPSTTRMMSQAEVYVDVEFLVRADGTIKDVAVIDSNADWRTQNEVRTAMRHARFRPKFVDGKPVPEKISTRWTYRVPEHLRRTVRSAESDDQAADSAN